MVCVYWGDGDRMGQDHSLVKELNKASMEQNQFS